MQKTAFAIFALLLAVCAAAVHAGQQEGVVDRALAGPLKDVEEVVFAVRGHVKNLHYYENFGRQYGNRYLFAEGGGRLCALNLRTRQLRDILNDPEGAVRDPQVHYDGSKILFSYRPGGENHYNLFEINADGSGLRRITEVDEDDIEPAYLPDGGIMFVSTRCQRRVPCWSSPVAILYRCDADGSNLRMLSASVEHENTPWVLPDGRVLYTRWEYVDRNEIDFHHLWVVNPDGTKHMTYYGNMNKHTKGGVLAMLDAKPIPGTNKVVCTYVFHNTPEHGGEVRVIDPDRGPDEEDAARLVSNEYPESIAKLGHTSHSWRDPYPVSEECFLVASQKSLYVMDGDGNWEVLYEHKEGTVKLWVHEPRPLVSRPREEIVVDTTDLSKDHGTLMLYEAHTGRRMDGVEPGEIKKLLVMEELPKAVSFSVDMDSTSLDGTFLLHRILGTIPVESDGSAHFQLPANRGFFFVAVDERDRAVKRMMSFVSVAPGETVSCVGCHENRTMTPPPSKELVVEALKRGPSQLDPIEGIPEVIDYMRDVQPVWDRSCVKCHDYEKYAGDLALTGDASPSFALSYLNIQWSGLVSDGDQGPGNRAPYSIGAVASPLWQTLQEPHHGVKLSDADMKVLYYWIESSAAYCGTLAGLGMRYRGIKVPIDDEAWKERCAGCHPDSWLNGRWVTGRSRMLDRIYNLTEPEKSLALLAPLSKEAGGLGLCRQRKATSRPPGDINARNEPKAAEPATVFESKDDPFYLSMLGAIREAAETRNRRPAYYMEGYRPTGQYIEEMKRFGVLPEDWTPEGKTLEDYFRIDQRYWEQQWFEPRDE